MAAHSQNEINIHCLITQLNHGIQERKKAASSVHMMEKKACHAESLHTYYK